MGVGFSACCNNSEEEIPVHTGLISKRTVSLSSSQNLFIETEDLGSSFEGQQSDRSSKERCISPPIDIHSPLNGGGFEVANDNPDPLDVDSLDESELLLLENMHNKVENQTMAVDEKNKLGLLKRTISMKKQLDTLNEPDWYVGDSPSPRMTHANIENTTNCTTTTTTRGVEESKSRSSSRDSIISGNDNDVKHLDLSDDEIITANKKKNQTTLCCSKEQIEYSPPKISGLARALRGESVDENQYQSSVDTSRIRKTHRHRRAKSSHLSSSPLIWQCGAISEEEDNIFDDDNKSPTNFENELDKLKQHRRDLQRKWEKAGLLCS